MTTAMNRNGATPEVCAEPQLADITCALNDKFSVSLCQRRRYGSTAIEPAGNVKTRLRRGRERSSQIGVGDDVAH
jgi:hypothetical protein